MVTYRKIDLETTEIDKRAYQACPKNLAKKHCFMPIKLNNKMLLIAVRGDLKENKLERTLNNISSELFVSGVQIVPVLASKKQIKKAIKTHYK